MPSYTAYLLGAGASVNALPLVADINSGLSQRIRSISSVIDILERLRSRGLSHEVDALLNGQIKELKLLRDHFNDFPLLTTDTVMRKYYFSNSEVYNRLKIALNLYFNLVEYINPIDHRYDALFTNLLSNDRTLPSNIIFLNWNYDRQIRQTLEELEGFNVKPEFHFLSHSDSEIPQGIKEVKLNGVFAPTSLGAKHFKETTISDNLLDHLQRTVYNPRHDYYNISFTEQASKTIKFAWENTAINSKLNEELEKVEELVVVGYSFPYFNRSTDKKMLVAMSFSKPLKVIIQDKSPEKIEQIMKNIMSSFANNLTFQHQDPDVFYIPEN
jgi:hypothetical protein